MHHADCEETCQSWQMGWSLEQIWHKTDFLLNSDFLRLWCSQGDGALLIVVPSLFLPFFFFLNNIFPLQAQESLAALEREIGKVFGDANVIENSDVCTDSVSVSMSSCSGATQISGKVGTLESEVQQSAAGG